MKSRSIVLGALSVAALVAAAGAAPTLISLGTGIALGVSNPQSGVYYLGGSGGTGTTNATRWTLNGGSLTVQDAGTAGTGYISADGQFLTVSIVNLPRFASGNSATGVSPAFRAPTYTVPALTVSTTQPGPTEFGGGRWNAGTNTITNLGVMPTIPFTPNPAPAIDIGNSGVFGTSGSGQAGSSFTSTHNISPNGRFIVGQAYVCVYNQGSTAGTSISNNSFYWRPYLWDAQANGGAGGITVLPTPFRTSTSAGANTRRRTGAAYAVSNDGLVIVGAQEHNVGGSPGADPDNARLVVWRWNAGTSKFDMTYLPNGTDANGFMYGQSQTPGSVVMNSTGTIIVGRAQESITGRNYLAKWLWNAGTNSWDAPINLGYADTLVAPASWLPFAVTSCGTPPNIGGSLAMTEDGNTVVGTAVYSTCGSFMTGGFIWTNTSGVLTDWYDYCVAQGVPDVTTNYGPIGDLGNPAKGLPKLGSPSAISPDGLIITGFQGGTQRIVGAVPWVMRMTSGGADVAPTIVQNPVASSLFSKCTSSVILNVAASGTQPLTYQWYKNGNPISAGATGNGSTYFIDPLAPQQFRINSPAPADAGSYHCVVTGAGGATATSTATAVAVDPTIPQAANDLCAGAITVGEGIFTYNVCQMMTDDQSVPGPSCSTVLTTADAYYKYVPTFTGNARIESCGTSYDSVLTVYSSCGGSEIACNDNYTTGPSSLTSPTTSCGASVSRIARLPVQQGVPVYIRMASKTTSLFTFSTSTIRITANPPAEAAGNNCSNPIAAIKGANAFDLTESDNGGDVVTCNITVNTRDVWFSYTPQVDGTMRVSTCPGTTINTVISVHNACFSPDLLCNDNAPAVDCGGTGTGTVNQSVLKDIAVTGGQQYLIRVAGNTATAIGAGTMTLSYTPVRCSPADIAYGDGEPLPPIGFPGGFNPVGPDGGDFDCFFNFYFAAAPDNAICDIAYGDGEPLPPFGIPGGFNPGVDGGDFDCFFNFYFSGCTL